MGSRDDILHSHGAEGRSLLVPAMPIPLHDELCEDDPYILGGAGRHWIGWQKLPLRQGGPSFAVFRASLLGYGYPKIIETFPLTRGGWDLAWQALLKLDANAARHALVNLTERAPRDRLNLRLLELDESTLGYLGGVFFLGGYTHDSALTIGATYDLRFLEDRLLVLPCRRADILVEVPYVEVGEIRLDAAGPVGIDRRLDVVAGLQGAVVAYRPGFVDAQVGINSIVRVQGVNCELFMLHAGRRPEELQIDLSRSLGAVRQTLAKLSKAADFNVVNGDFSGSPVYIVQAGNISGGIHVSGDDKASDGRV